MRAAVLEVHGGAAARVREGRHPAGAGAAPRRLGGGREARPGPHPRHQLAARLLPLLRAAHLPPGERLRRHHGQGRRPAHHGPRGRRLRPHRVVRSALHRQPAGVTGHRPPAPRHRSGRGRLRPVLRRPRADRLRRDRHVVRLRLGGPAPPTPASTCATPSARTSTSGPPHRPSSHQLRHPRRKHHEHPHPHHPPGRRHLLGGNRRPHLTGLQPGHRRADRGPRPRLRGPRRRGRREREGGLAGVGRGRPWPSAPRCSSPSASSSTNASRRSPRSSPRSTARSSTTPSAR